MTKTEMMMRETKTLERILNEYNANFFEAAASYESVEHKFKTGNQELYDRVFQYLRMFINL